MAINLDRKPPGVFGILFGAVSGIVLGALLAVLSLVAKPPEVVREEPKEPVAGAVYFVRGSMGGATWEAKWRSLEAGGGEVAVSEGELNAWSKEVFTVAKIDESNAAPILIKGRPNFRLAGKELQIGMENDLHFGGSAAPLIFQVKGSPERIGERWTLRTSEAYLGSLPLHRVPAALGAVARRIAPTPSDDDELKEVLARTTSIEVVKDVLVFRVR